MTFVDFIEQIERFPDRCSNRVASVDELSLVADVFVEVIKQFLGYLDADLRHTIVFAEEYLQSVAQHRTCSQVSLLQDGALVWVAWFCGTI